MAGAEAQPLSHAAPPTPYCVRIGYMAPWQLGCLLPKPLPLSQPSAALPTPPPDLPAELYQFMKKVRAGEAVSSDELLRFAKLFNDELTLDNLERCAWGSWGGWGLGDCRMGVGEVGVAVCMGAGEVEVGVGPCLVGGLRVVAVGLDKERVHTG